MKKSRNYRKSALSQIGLVLGALGSGGAMIIKKNSILDRIAKWKGAMIIKGGVR
jgi:hypothetical protein